MEVIGILFKYEIGSFCILISFSFALIFDVIDLSKFKKQTNEWIANKIIRFPSSVIACLPVRTIWLIRIEMVFLFDSLVEIDWQTERERD